MRHLLLILLLTGTALNAVFARSLPFTIKEVTLMLRSGYSSEAVQQELSVRRLAESCDAAGEKALRDAGADPALIDAIKTGSYESSATDAQATRELLATQAKKQAAENERLRKMDIALPKPTRASKRRVTILKSAFNCHRRPLEGRFGSLEKRKSGSLPR